MLRSTDRDHFAHMLCFVVPTKIPKKTKPQRKAPSVLTKDKHKKKNSIKATPARTDVAEEVTRS